MRIYEIVSTKPLTPEQARLKALKDQADRARAAVKAEKARQKIGSGQAQLNNINSS
jgi:hypothetical protein